MSLIVILRGFTDLFFHGVGKVIVVSLIPVPFILCGGYPLLKEWLRLTYYPIRFNRKN